MVLARRLVALFLTDMLVVPIGPVAHAARPDTSACGGFSPP